jgi:hypothetical protein
MIAGPSASSSSSSWNDKFLRLSGPELLRVDLGMGKA